MYCRPPKKEGSNQRALAQRPPELPEASLNIEVDTPVDSLPPLSSLKVAATVGMPRLQMNQMTNMAVSFTGRAGDHIQVTIGTWLIYLYNRQQLQVSIGT